MTASCPTSDHPRQQVTHGQPEAEPAEEEARRRRSDSAEHERPERHRPVPPRRHDAANPAAAKNTSEPSASSKSPHCSSVSAWTVSPDASRFTDWPSASVTTQGESAVQESPPPVAGGDVV